MIPYQGSKERFADTILDYIKPDRSKKFYDMCCGTGAISLKLIDRGFDPSNIVMVDAGPWGLFWQRVGEGSFSISRFAELCEEFSRTNAVDWAKAARETPLDDEDSVYRFLLLQSMSWNGTPVRFNRRNTFSTSGLRDKPSPGVDVLFGRVVVAVSKMLGVDGRLEDARAVKTEPGATVYYDPPYGGHNPYSFDLPVRAITQNEYYISYGVDLARDALQIDRNRTANVKGYTYNNFEYLSKVSR